MSPFAFWLWVAFVIFAATAIAPIAAFAKFVRA